MGCQPGARTKRGGYPAGQRRAGIPTGLAPSRAFWPLRLLKRLLRPSQFIAPYNLAEEVALLNAREPPNSFAAPLSPALIRYFTSQQQNTNKEVYEDAYVSSDETSNYDNVLSVLMRERLVEIRGSLSETLKPTKRVSHGFQKPFQLSLKTDRTGIYN